MKNRRRRKKRWTIEDGKEEEMRRKSWSRRSRATRRVGARAEEYSEKESKSERSRTKLE